MNFGALWGTWFGVAGGVLLDLEGDALLGSTLVGGDAGLLTTALLAPGWNMSRNRARLISIAGVIGALAGAGMDLITRPDDEKVAIGIPLATSIAGLAIGAGLTANEGRRSGPESLGSGPDGELLGLGASLLRLRDGAFSWDLPAPFATFQPVDRKDGFSLEPALGVTLFSARF